MVSNRPNLARRVSLAMLLVLLMAAFIVPGRTSANTPYEFTGIVGIVASPEGSLFVADPGAGIVELRNGRGKLVVELPGIADLALVSNGVMVAITSGGVENSKVYRVTLRGRKVEELADLGAYENTVNPDGREVNPNPFDVAMLSNGKILVTDAGGNTLLIVDKRGKIETVAVLPDQVVPTNNLKILAGCPNPPEPLAFACDLPEAIPAQAVATSVVVGPDGAYYVSELTGFPAPTGMSRVWRIKPSARNADCAVSPDCSVALSGFTSIVDLALGPDGKLYVLELDEASFLALELGSMGLPPATQGGTVNACDISTAACEVVVGGLPIPLAVAVDNHNKLHYSILSLVPSQAQVISMP